MAGTRPDEERRHAERADRLQREAARRRRQLVAAPVGLVALVVLVTAFAWRPAAPSDAGPAQAASVAATSPPTQSAQAAATSEPTGSALPTRSVDASRSAESTSGGISNGSAATSNATGAAAIAAPKPLRPAPGVKTIVVDKSEQRVTLYTAKGTPVDTFRCASGITYPRIGTYKVYGHRKQSWSIYDASTFYYFTMFVKSDKGNNIGFHSIPVMPDGKLVGKLGVPVSHGCVRLDKAKAKFVYSWAPVGTKVVVKR
jgi:lipoprotein-anchoring transpeptidase ErfK/SrfK